MFPEHLELYSDQLEEPKADLGDGSGWTSFLQTETGMNYFLGPKTRNLQRAKLQTEMFLVLQIFSDI